MRSFFVLAVAGVAVALSATAVQAATLNFTGNIMATGTNSPPFLANGTFNLFVDYPESTTQTNGNATASTFSAQRQGGGTLDYNKPVFLPVSLAFGKAGNNDTLTITGTYTPVTSGQPALGVLSLVFTRAQFSSQTLLLNSTNVAAMLSHPSTYAGTFQQTNGEQTSATAVLGGSIAVPEPGSISLLAGLGLVCGRRVWRRRQQKQAAAV